jgi:DMSO reductase anchor subunit
MLWLDLPLRAPAGFATALFGAAGITCSAKIYMVRARPAWCTRYTLAEFLATALLLGPLFVRALGVFDESWTAVAAAIGGSAQLLTQTLRFLWLSCSDQFELRAASLQLSGPLRTPFLVRLMLLVAAGIVVPLAVPPGGWSALVLVAAVIGELTGRWLFFASVVPKSMAAAFTVRPGAAA